MSAPLRRDTLVVNATIVDVITQSTYRGWFAIQRGRFVEVEAGDPPAATELIAAHELDAEGAVVLPGLLDVHMHIESSLVTPRRFAEAVLPWGTTTVLQDPHEVGNVLGPKGIRWMIEASRGLPLRVLSAIPSCVPATSAELETPNASVTPDDATRLAEEPGVVALGEMMDFQGLINGDRHLQGMLAAGVAAGLSLEGHVPSLTGPELSRYVAHGIRSDHTLMSPAKMHEQLRKGLWVMVQEKSLSGELVEAVMALPDRSRVMLITDDVMPNRLLSGHLSRLIQTAVELGWAPLDAIAAATLRPASYLGLDDLGAIAPGKQADFLVMDDLTTFPPQVVYRGGERVAEGGRARPAAVTTPNAPFLATAFGVRSLPPERFTLPTGAGEHIVRARVVNVNQVNSFTTLDERDVLVKDGVPQHEDLALATVIPRAALRDDAPEHLAIGLVAGLGLQRGAWAATFAHDSHNVFVLGRSPRAMADALAALLADGGGMVLVPDEGVTPVRLPLPLAGLLSDDPISAVAERFDALERGLRDAGVGVKHPVLLLTLLPLTVSPDWKLSDKGVVDVGGRRVLPTLVGP